MAAPALSLGERLSGGRRYVPELIALPALALRTPCWCVVTRGFILLARLQVDSLKKLEHNKLLVLHGQVVKVAPRLPPSPL